MRHLLALTLSCVLVVGVVLASAATALAYTPDNEELTFLALINDYRAQQGLGALAINPELGAAAEVRSQDMGATGYFDHTAPDGTTFDQTIKRNGYQGDTVGENIAAGMETAAAAMVAWQNSPEHNAGMLNPAYSEIGIGRAFVEGSEFGWYWTTTFGGGVLPGGATQINADGTNNRGRDSSTITDTVIAEPSSSITSGEPAPTEPTTNVSEYDGEVVETQQEAAPEAGPAVNADGANVSASDDGAGPAVGDGTVTTYPDINTGGVQGDNVNYDQSVTPPSTSTTAPPAEQTAPPPAETAAPVEAPAEAAAPVDSTTTTTTPNNGTVTETYSENIQEGDGNAQSLGNTTNADASSQSGTVTTDGAVSEPVAPAVTDAAPVDPAAAPAPVDTSGVDPALAGLGCADYPTWYDAQVAYETGGGTAADPAFVNSLDPNADGVACEELMNY